MEEQEVNKILMSALNAVVAERNELRNSIIELYHNITEENEEESVVAEEEQEGEESSTDENAANEYEHSSYIRQVHEESIIALAMKLEKAVLWKLYHELRAEFE